MKREGIPEAVYLCATIVKEKFRGMGLATLAYVKAINKITSNRKEKPTLFYWEYSKEGGKLVKKVADKTGLELIKRE